MKPLHQLNNVEKAKLLFELFPSEIPGFLNLVKEMNKNIINNEIENRQTWGQHQLFDYDHWLSFARDTEKRLQQYGDRLTKRASLFADQLFDGLNACYMSHCLHVYSKIKKPQPVKFKMAIELFFTYSL